MSGIEVAGLVLGALPLLIAAAGCYADGIRTLKGLRPKDMNDKIRDFNTDILVELYLLRNALERLVNILDLPADLKDQLRTDDATLKLWESPLVTNALNERLDCEGTTIFYISLQKIAEAIVELVRLDETLSSAQNVGLIRLKADLLSQKLEALRKGKHKHTKLYERIKHMTKEGKQTGLHNSLTKYNRNIQGIIEIKSIVTANSVGLSRKTPSMRMRTRAQTLYEVLGQCWECRCNDKAHKTLAALEEARLCLYRDFHSSTPGDLSFDVVFSIRKASLNSASSHLWQESIIQSKECITPSLQSQGLQASDREQINCFSMLIHNLLHKGYHSCLRMLLYDDKTLWRVSPETKRIDIRNTVSLKEELQSGRRTLVQKNCLAVTLSHTVLQLSESPWLNRKWDEAHVLFFKTKLPQTDKIEVDLQRPYVTTRFEQAPPGVDPDSINCEHPNESLLSLGVVLLEIHQSKPMEVEAEDHAPGGHRTNTIFRAAIRLLDEVMGDLRPNWKKAIQSCLHPQQFYSADSTLHNEEVRKGVYANIVAPLEAEYRDLLE